MHKITLVCTVHRESGRCTAEELHKVLRAIGPEVIFEEVRPSDFDAYYTTRSLLEVRAITKYRESRSFSQVPVDHFNDTETTAILRDQMDVVFGYVEETSQTYRDLLEEQGSLVDQQGIQYLNSVAFEKTAEKLEAIEDATIRGSGNLGLIRSLQWWREMNKRREAEMIRAIYDYCQGHEFDAGVFLVGAAHKASVCKAIRDRDGVGVNQINWTFTYAGRN